MSCIGISKAMAEGQKGTYRGTNGGIGLGYLLHGMVYVSGGNGFAYHREVTEFQADGGRGYIAAVRGLAK